MWNFTASHLVLQTEKPPFDDLRVRQAISEALKREAFGELGTQAGVVGTGNFPLDPWALPKDRREQLVGYGPDMTKRIAHAKALLASYEQEKGPIDWKKIKAQCATNIKCSCEHGQIMQQMLKNINVNVELEPMLFAQLRANEVWGNFLMSLLGEAMEYQPWLPATWDRQTDVVVAGFGAASVMPRQSSHGIDHERNNHVFPNRRLFSNA